MSSLVIVESPAKAKTIARFLGKNYRVEASFGHVRDLPDNRKSMPEKYRKEKWADFGVNVEADFEPFYIVSEGKEKQVRLLKEALKNADELLLATDEDREGESISWHLLEVLKPKVPVRRIVFHEITREAIKEALANPRDVDENLVRAQESRRILDRLYGYSISPLLWRKVQTGLSAGRVQSVAVRLIVEREEERRAFRSGEYWDIEAEIGAGAGSFKATLVSVGGKRVATGKDFDTLGRLANEKSFLLDGAQCEALNKRLRQSLPWSVGAIEEKPAAQRPYPPFTTSTLQQEANRKLGYGARRTMQIAQKLYEGVDVGEGERVGIITYMRTDSTTLSEKALKDSQTVIRQLYGDDYAQGFRTYKTKQASAQEAHEAIRPTEVSRRPAELKSYLEKDELALYELIWKRTIASQMPDAKLLRTSVEIVAHGAKGDAVFSASGKKILFPGFLRAYVEGSDDPEAEFGDQEAILPDLKTGQKVAASAKEGPLHLLKLDNKKHETQPPPRYTEASLVKKLEEEGIGRPSTYASILDTIQDRGYVLLNKSKQLAPTFTAFAVTQLLRDHFSEYVDIKFTARLEEELDGIADGRTTWLEHVKSFYRGTPKAPGLEQIVEEKKNSIGFPAIPIGTDPETGLAVSVRVGRYGPFIVRGEEGSQSMASVPKDVAPADLTIEKALELLAQKAEGPRVVGTDPATGQKVYATNGRFGAYVQLGETPEDKGAEKPRRASLDPGQTVEGITLEEALTLLALPRVLGNHPETGTPILANKGRYGPYVQHDRDFRSLTDADNVHTVTLERALEILAAPKQSRARNFGAKKVIKDLGANKDGKQVQVLEGRYGAYVSDGEGNATVPKGLAPEGLTLDAALGLLAERAAAGGKKGKKPARGAAARRPAAAKAENAPAKKAAAKPKKK